MLVDAVAEISQLLAQLSAGREFAVGFVMRAVAALERELLTATLASSAVALPDGLVYRPRATQMVNGRFTHIASTGTRAPLQFVHSGPAPVTVNLHRGGVQASSVAVPRDSLLLFPGDVDYSVDAGHTLILVGEMIVSPRR